MNPNVFDKSRSCNHSARELESGERGAQLGFLAEACRGDEKLRREVESLGAGWRSRTDGAASDED
jgi:hypothetical protein